MSTCPCQSQLDYQKCCQPFLENDQAPPTAVALMRSRYSAFTKGKIEYISATHHPDARGDFDENETKLWADNSQWLGLEIKDSDRGGENDDKGTVEFIATYKQKGQTFRHHELSDFQKVDGKWYFVDGQVINEPFKREGEKVGRNDPCPCGSGKKFKKCCA